MRSRLERLALLYRIRTVTRGGVPRGGVKRHGAAGLTVRLVLCQRITFGNLVELNCCERRPEFFASLSDNASRSITQLAGSTALKAARNLP